MLAFFNNGLMASVEQNSDRIRRYCAPFDAELAAALGLSATQALLTAHGIAETLQTSLDALQASFGRIALFDSAAAEGGS